MKEVSALDKKKKGAGLQSLTPLLDFENLILMVQMYNESNHSESSKRSFNELVKTGKLSKYKFLILKELEKASLTRRELTDKVRAKHPSNLCGPLKILENEGIIKVVNHVVDPFTCREVSLYALCEKSYSLEFPLVSIRNSYASSEHLSQDLEPKSQDNE